MLRFTRGDCAGEYAGADEQVQSCRSRGGKVESRCI